MGQPCDVVLRADSPALVGQVAFTVSTDPRTFRLQSVRRGEANGAESPGAPTFIAEGAPGSGESIIRTGLSSGSRDNGSLAILQFEALAAGTVTIVISDLVITDPAGRAIASEASPLRAEAEVLSGGL